MQFLEWSVIGLRSARHVFKHHEKDVAVTLFPMVHLGEPGFYEDVYDDASGHDIVVREGVNSPISKRLTRVYRWAKPSRLGLVVQPKFLRDGVETVLADLPSAQFDALWQQSPRRERMVFEAGATIMGPWLRLTATHESIGKKLTTSDAKERDSILAWTERTAPMFNALETARDQVLCRTVLDLVAKGVPPRSIAVIYGAGHMGALSRALTGAGFRLAQSEWMRVFAA